MSPRQLQRIRRTLERRARAWLVDQPSLSVGVISATIVDEVARAVDLGDAREELLRQLERFVAQRAHADHGTPQYDA
jgi:hypothetical protein